MSACTVNIDRSAVLISQVGVRRNAIEVIYDRCWQEFVDAFVYVVSGSLCHEDLKKYERTSFAALEPQYNKKLL